MRLSAFISGHMREILSQWDDYARTLSPAADAMSLEALRDHAEQMLRAIALDIETSQTDAEQSIKSMGGSDDDTASNAASEHGRMRHESEFTLTQLNAEFRALRASVLQLWLGHVDGTSREVLDELMRFNEAVDQALAESIATFSERAEYARNMFDAILGHDLRGPLSSISCAGELLTRHELRSEKAIELGHRIKSSARYMTAMVNDLLEFARSRLGVGTLPVQPQMANLSHVCKQAIADAQAMHPDCQYQLVVTCQLDAWVDPDRIHQLLVNLLGNAGQHGAPGRVIEMQVAGDEDEAVLCVVNEGNQIPPASLKRVFEPMVRLKPEAHPDGHVVGSLGLGLHIAREIALAHGGTIVAESDASHTRFTVRLPRQGRSDAKWVGSSHGRSLPTAAVGFHQGAISSSN